MPDSEGTPDSVGAAEDATGDSEAAVGRSVKYEKEGRSVRKGISDWDGISEYDDGISEYDVGVSVEDGAATGCASHVVGPQKVTGG